MKFNLHPPVSRAESEACSPKLDVLGYHTAFEVSKLFLKGE